MSNLLLILWHVLGIKKKEKFREQQAETGSNDVKTVGFFSARLIEHVYYLHDWNGADSR